MGFLPSATCHDRLTSFKTSWKFLPAFGVDSFIALFLVMSHMGSLKAWKDERLTLYLQSKQVPLFASLWRCVSFKCKTSSSLFSPHHGNPVLHELGTQWLTHTFAKHWKYGGWGHWERLLLVSILVWIYTFRTRLNGDPCDTNTLSKSNTVKAIPLVEIQIRHRIIYYKLHHYNSPILFFLSFMLCGLSSLSNCL